MDLSGEFFSLLLCFACFRRGVIRTDASPFCLVSGRQQDLYLTLVIANVINSPSTREVWLNELSYVFTLILLSFVHLDLPLILFLPTDFRSEMRMKEPISSWSNRRCLILTSWQKLEI